MIQKYQYLLIMKRIIYFLLFFVASIQVNCQSLLWKISKSGIQKPSYLYGTMHTQDSEVYKFGDAVVPALKSVDVVGLEVINLEDPSNLMYVMHSMMMIDGKLSDHLSDEDMEILKAKLNEVDPMLSMFYDQIKPFYLYALLSNGSLTMDKDNVLDLYFEKLGKEENKEIWGIETIQEHLSSIDQIEMEEQIAMLKEVITAYKLKEQIDEDEMLKLTMNIYGQKDLKKLYEFYKLSNPSPSFHKALLVDRNIRMTHRMDSLMTIKSVFLAVGALHLCGEEGLIQSLINKGYTVEPVISEYSPPKFDAAMQTEWISYTDKNWFYKIQYPNIPIETTDSIKMYSSDKYQISGHSYYNDKENQIVYEVISFNHETPIAPPTYLEWLGATMSWKRKDISHLNIPANIAEYNLEPGRNKLVKIFFHNKKAYLIGITGDTDLIHSVSEKFFDSFHFISSYEEKVISKPTPVTKP